MPTLIPMSVNVTNGPCADSERVGRPRCAPRRGGACRPSSRDPGSGSRPGRSSCSPGRSRDRTRSTRRRSPVGMAVAANRLGHGGLAYRRAGQRRLHSGRGRSGPDRDRHRRHPRDLDDLPGAGRRLPSGCSARPRSRRLARCARRSARASSAASGTRFASPASTSATRRASTSSRRARRSSSRRRTGRAPSSLQQSAASASSSRRC